MKKIVNQMTENIAMIVIIQWWVQKVGLTILQKWYLEKYLEKYLEATTEMLY